MSPCDSLVQDATGGVGASLRAVDCVSSEATASAFSRLFGTHGALLPALTILLTLYIGAFAVLLLTGRARLSLNALTPRMVMLGLVLTFTTSSVAYQGVVWNLAVGAPDQVAGVLLGVQGSATRMFGDRIDILFNAIADAASTATQTGAPQQGGQGAFTPNNLMWVSALLLLLGTVGVLITSRIVLAILLAVGPVFITLLLFRGTRGLFAGWLRGVVLTAFTPLVAVLGGAAVVELAAPVVVALRNADGLDGSNGRAAIALFVIAVVYCAVMALAIRVASTMVAGWRVFGLAGEDKETSSSRAGAAIPAVVAPVSAPTTSTSRSRALVAAMPAAALGGFGLALEGAAVSHNVRNILIPATASGGSAQAFQSSRARGIGSRFSSRATTLGKLLK